MVPADIYSISEVLRNSATISHKIKVPTPEQLTNAILYCKKYDIPYIDKFSKPAFQDKFGKQILHEAYGLHEPIIYKFKTPSTLKIKQGISLKNISKSLSKKTELQDKTKKNKKTKKTSFRFSNLFDNDSNSNEASYHSSSHKTHKTHKTQTSRINKKNYKTPSLKQQYTHMINLIPELDPINNRIEQTTKLIDSRKDFDAPESMQNLK